MSLATRALVAACRGVYRATDVARHFGVSKATVYRVWNTDDDPKVDPPNIWDTKVTAEILQADAPILARRGMTVQQIADHFGVRPARITEALSMGRAAA